MDYQVRSQNTKGIAKRSRYVHWRDEKTAAEWVRKVRRAERSS